MEHKKIIHLLHCPWTGLGLYSGFRGNRWLKNRVKVFKQFVIPSLQAQSSKNFVLWCAFRREEKTNPIVKELVEYMNSIKEFKTVFTYHGICFWDDKYPDDVARDRLLTSLHGSMGELIDTIGEVDYVLMTIQPSDDVYRYDVVEGVQNIFNENPNIDGCGFTKGYIMNYQTKDVREYNPKTNPPFYTIKFQREVFIDPLRHADFTALKKDVGKYKKGTPIPSHEYVPDAIRYAKINERGFLVGCHGSNISTTFDNPFGGEKVPCNVLEDFGILNVEKLVIPLSFGKIIFDKLPYKFKRKLRYLAGEKKWILRPIFSIIYNILRS